MIDLLPAPSVPTQLLDTVAAMKREVARAMGVPPGLLFKPLDTARLASDHRPRVWVSVTKRGRAADCMNTAALKRRLRP